MPEARMIHLHGVMPDGTDQVDLSYFDKELLKKIIKLADDGRERVMSIEVFEDDYFRSLEVIKDFKENYFN